VAASETLQFTLSGITTGSVYAVVALGFTIVFNASGVVNFAHGEFVMLAGLLAVWLVALHLPLWAAAAGAVVIVAGIAAAVHALTVRSIERTAGHFTMIMVTLGVAMVLQVLAEVIFGTEAQALPAFSGDGAIRVFTATITLQALWVLAGAAVLMAGLYVFFTRTRAGQAMLATAENREAAGLVGIDTRRVSLHAYVLGCGVGALAGVLVTPMTAAVYTQGLVYTLKGFAAAALGGFGSPVGAVIGGLALGLLEAFSAGVVSSGYQDLIALIALIGILMFRPGGIVGTRVLG
jgi:branched-chain amino acid transport system permease protein